MPELAVLWQQAWSARLRKRRHRAGMSNSWLYNHNNAPAIGLSAAAAKTQLIRDGIGLTAVDGVVTLAATAELGKLAVGRVIGWHRQPFPRNKQAGELLRLSHTRAPFVYTESQSR